MTGLLAADVGICQLSNPGNSFVGDDCWNSHTVKAKMLAQTTKTETIQGRYILNSTRMVPPERPPPPPPPRPPATGVFNSFSVRGRWRHPEHVCYSSLNDQMLVRARVQRRSKASPFDHPQPVGAWLGRAATNLVVAARFALSKAWHRARAGAGGSPSSLLPLQRGPRRLPRIVRLPFRLYDGDAANRSIFDQFVELQTGLAAVPVDHVLVLVA